MVATPVATLEERIGDVLDAAGNGATVTDVGSTKSALCAAVPDRALHRRASGLRLRGAGAGERERAALRRSDVVPDAGAETEPERYRLLHGFVASLGAVPWRSTRSRTTASSR